MIRLSDVHFSEWFAAELRPHEPVLRAWLAGQFNETCDIDDMVGFSKDSQADVHLHR